MCCSRASGLGADGLGWGGGHAWYQVYVLRVAVASVVVPFFLQYSLFFLFFLFVMLDGPSMHSSWLAGFERVPIISRRVCVGVCFFRPRACVGLVAGGRVVGGGWRRIKCIRRFWVNRITSTSVAPCVVPTDECRSVLVDWCDGIMIF